MSTIQSQSSSRKSVGTQTDNKGVQTPKVGPSTNNRSPQKASNTLGNSTERRTKIDQDRAQQARRLHCAAGHPSDKILKEMLSAGKYKECFLSPRDVDAANAILGKCVDCQRANMPEPPSPPSNREPPREDGESFQADIFFIKNEGSRKSPYLLLVDERNG
jgi:hypothetical protein